MLTHIPTYRFFMYSCPCGMKSIFLKHLFRNACMLQSIQWLSDHTLMCIFKHKGNQISAIMQTLWLADKWFHTDMFKIEVQILDFLGGILPGHCFKDTCRVMAWYMDIYIHIHMFFFNHMIISSSKVGLGSSLQQQEAIMNYSCLRFF